ncbi:unnamed protein product [Lepeophtheirus salmonis]|uniref:(salmon louse) hypothetical protein n=1 Tax=Lepeophtheirus salmonis TaxID=72036 RepID=A0A7R8CAL5_LEPSM|nr:unnamed protein product [Lepeophtheirus salmonis]CAF2752400.1 unnamed protein product [Lepeophtheirus salmonis]
MCVGETKTSCSIKKKKKEMDDNFKCDPLVGKVTGKVERSNEEIDNVRPKILSIVLFLSMDLFINHFLRVHKTKSYQVTMRARILGISFQRRIYFGLILMVLLILFAYNIPIKNLFIQFKKWWYKNIVLEGSVYVSDNSELNEHIVLSRVRELPDFEYSYPNPYSYALIWVSTNEIEVCSSLASMLKMQSYFKDSSFPISYVLLSSMDTDSLVIKERWESSRGKFIHVPKDKLKWIDKTSGIRHYATQLPFTWIALIDSKGIPLMKLKNMIEEIFFKKNTYRRPILSLSDILYSQLMKNSTRMPRKNGQKIATTETPLHCWTRISSSSNLRNFIFNRLSLYEETNIDFHQAINTEFHCNHETYVLEFNSSLRDVDLLHSWFEFSLVIAVRNVDWTKRPKAPAGLNMARSTMYLFILFIFIWNLHGSFLLFSSHPELNDKTSSSYCEALVIKFSYIWFTIFDIATITSILIWLISLIMGCMDPDFLIIAGIPPPSFLLKKTPYPTISKRGNWIKTKLLVRQEEEILGMIVAKLYEKMPSFSESRRGSCVSTVIITPPQRLNEDETESKKIFTLTAVDDAA